MNSRVWTKSCTQPQIKCERKKKRGNQRPVGKRRPIDSSRCTSNFGAESIRTQSQRPNPHKTQVNRGFRLSDRQRESRIKSIFKRKRLAIISCFSLSAGIVFGFISIDFRWKRFDPEAVKKLISGCPGCNCRNGCHGNAHSAYNSILDDKDVLEQCHQWALGRFRQFRSLWP